MAANAPETPVQALVVFVIESTAVNGQFINELKTNYLIPTLEYFHGGVLDEGGGCGSMYGLVTYKAADSLFGYPISTNGPFTCPQTVMHAVDAIQFISGQAESRACVTEALVAALSCLDDFGRSDLPRHILLLGCSPPYSAYGGGLVPPGMPATIEQAARLVSERGAVLSIVAPRRLNALSAVFELSGGDLLQAQQRNYAKDPKHLVLLRGYSLKERPPSPAPPPVPEIQTEVGYGQRQQTPAVRPTGPQAFPRAGVTAAGTGVGPMGPVGPVGQVGQVGPVGQVGNVGQVGAVGGPAVRGNWLARQPLYPNNSALLTQLAQPSYPPPPPQAQQQQNLVRMGMPGQSGVPGAGGMPVAGGMPGAPQRTYIWSGVLEWMEKGKGPGDHQKLTKHLPCQVSANSKDIEPELKVETWPNKLLMQLMPKQLISTIGGQYLKDSKSVLFHLQPNEALDALTKVMVNGFAGCVHFSSPPQCDIKVLILLYTPDKKAFLGFIPNNQATFVDRLKKVIQQQKTINKQQLTSASPAGGMPPSMPSQSIPGTSGMGGGLQGSLGGVQMPPASVPQPSQPMVSHSQPGMMISQGMSGQVGQVGQVQAHGKGRGQQVPQLDGLEAARQQNLEKIQQLQQTLEAAHQQEAQFKSQMDIMSHLHAAQQQEHHYKQLEEQRKHQLQQQLQQQLRGTQGVPGGLPGVGHPPRCVVRPMMASNPGLRHLLQQPQYRPGGNGGLPPKQQFDDVNNFDFM